MKKRSSRAVVASVVAMAFFVSAIGAKDCAPSTGTSSPVAVQSPPEKPFCPTDPPFGCAALCVNVGQVGFSDDCSQLSAGPSTAQFKESIAEAVIQAQDTGVELCGPDNLFAIVTPCDLGYAPSIGTESLDACMLRPQACP